MKNVCNINDAIEKYKTDIGDNRILSNSKKESLFNVSKLVFNNWTQTQNSCTKDILYKLFNPQYSLFIGLIENNFDCICWLSSIKMDVLKLDELRFLVRLILDQKNVFSKLWDELEITYNKDNYLILLKMNMYVVQVLTKLPDKIPQLFLDRNESDSFNWEDYMELVSRLIVDFLKFSENSSEKLLHIKYIVNKWMRFGYIPILIKSVVNESIQKYEFQTSGILLQILNDLDYDICLKIFQEISNLLFKVYAERKKELKQIINLISNIYSPFLNYKLLHKLIVYSLVNYDYDDEFLIIIYDFFIKNGYLKLLLKTTIKGLDNAKDIRNKAENIIIKRAIKLYVILLLSNSDDLNMFIKDLIDLIPKLLDSINENIRITGMLIGEKFSMIHDKEIKLKFDIDKNHKIFTKFMDIQNKYNLVMNKSILVIDNTKKENLQIQDDPLYFEPTELNMPSKEIIAEPKFIKESYNYLKTSDPKKLEMALKSLPKQILNASIISINEFFKQLTIKLLHISNDEYNFDELISKSLLNICIRSPERVIQLLVNEFYSKNHVVNQKIRIINILMNFIKDLSNFNTRIKYSKYFLFEGIQPKTMMDSINQITTNNVDESKNNTYLMNGSTSKLNKMSYLMFLELVSNFNQIENNKNNSIKELLVERLIYCFIFILFSLKCSIYYIEALEKILDFLKGIRSASKEAISLRIATLKCYHVILMICDNQRFPDVLNENLNDIVYWVRSIFDQDIDSDSKYYIITVLDIVKNNLKEIIFI